MENVCVRKFVVVVFFFFFCGNGNTWKSSKMRHISFLVFLFIWYGFLECCECWISTTHKRWKPKSFRNKILSKSNENILKNGRREAKILHNLKIHFVDHMNGMGYINTVFLLSIETIMANKKVFVFVFVCNMGTNFEFC